MDPQAIGVINQLKYTFIEDGKVNLSFNGKPPVTPVLHKSDF